MNTREVQRYKRLLVAKLDELSAMRADTAPSAPDAGGPMGDLADQANADYEAELHIRLHQTEARLLRAIENASARISQDRFGLQARYFEGPAGSCAMCSALQGLQGARAKLTLASANRFSECRRACPCNTWPPRRIHSI